MDAHLAPGFTAVNIGDLSRAVAREPYRQLGPATGREFNVEISWSRREA